MRHFERVLGQRLVVIFERDVGIEREVDLIDLAEEPFQAFVTILLTFVSDYVTNAV
jgi:hypothetical protein